jgi:uncharacterized RDD family membrane protein YckC
MKILPSPRVQTMYAGFWHRVMAFGLDCSIGVPFAVIGIYVSSLDKTSVLCLIPFQYGIYFVLSYLFVMRYEGTPGKRLVGLKIKRVNGERISWNNIVRRDLVNLVFTIIGTIAKVMTFLYMTDAVFNDLAQADQLYKWKDYGPGWAEPVSLLFGFWVLADLVAILRNRKKRALHDMIAGTVVIKDGYEIE